MPENSPDDESTILEDLLKRAASHGLELSAGSAVLDDTGWDFRVVHTEAFDGTAWILRAPRRRDAAASARIERRLLAMLRGRFDVAIPDWTIVHEELIAYPRLAGEPAASEDTKTFELRWRIDREHPPAAYVEPLGRLMAELHATPVADAEATGVPVFKPGDARAEFARRLAIGAGQFGMHPTWRDRAVSWLERDELWSERTVLIHGDLHPGHTLVDESGALVGVLDWTDARIGDPGQEFVEAARKFEPEMLDGLIRAYERAGGPSWPGLRAHVDEAIAFAPLELGLSGLAAGKTRYVEKARRWFGTPTRQVR